MRDLYEVLGIDSDADESQLKIAYRKAALQWHPDKNQSNLKEAEERFKEIQNAYEVLNDKHERAWYDGHKNEILRGGSRHQAGGGGGGVTPGQPPEDDINLFPYFSSTCFNGYRDGPAGFYGVYDALFSRLAQQEADAQPENDTDNYTPSFGTSTTAWPQVAAFYNYWTRFVTRKNFNWADKYNPASAANRKVRRLMEEDNKSARKAERSKYIDTVRELALFLQKRDKRVAVHKAEEARRLEEKETAEKLRKEEERAERRQRAREFEEAAWAEEDGSEGDDIEVSADAIPEELYCLACDKSFRTINAFANHEKSKKHLEKVALLRDFMSEEEEFADLHHKVSPGPLPSVPEEVAFEADEYPQEQATPPGSKPKLSKKEKKRQAAAAQFRRGHSQFVESSGGVSEDEQSDASSTGDAAAHFSSPAEDLDVRIGQCKDEGVGSSGASETEGSDLNDGEDAWVGNEEGLSGQADRSIVDHGSESSASSQGGGDVEDDSLEGLLKLQKGRRKAGGMGWDPGLDERPLDDADLTDAGEEGDGGVEAAVEAVAALKLEDSMHSVESGEAANKGRRRKKGPTPLAQATPSAPPPLDVKTKGRRGGNKARQKDAESSATQCAVCGKEFPSRSKMFQHIKTTGHAAPKY